MSIKIIIPKSRERRFVFLESEIQFFSLWFAIVLTKIFNKLYPVSLIGVTKIVEIKYAIYHVTSMNSKHNPAM